VQAWGRGMLLGTTAGRRHGTCPPRQLTSLLVGGKLPPASCKAFAGPSHLPAAAGSGKVPESLATCSSDGIIKLWDTRMMGGGAGATGGAACTAQVATNARLTCMAAVDPAAAPKPKPKALAAAAGAAGAGEGMMQVRHLGGLSWAP
jgi:hypothetical protein